MASLYKRATPRQARLLRMIAGACFNAAHYHPELVMNATLARGIAKRAVGTITSQWRDVLALPLQAGSEGGDAKALARPASARGQPVLPFARSAVTFVNRGTRDASQAPWRIPLLRLHAALGHAAGDARRSGELQREGALIDVLRLIGEITQASEPPGKRSVIRLARQRP